MERRTKFYLHNNSYLNHIGKESADLMQKTLIIIFTLVGMGFITACRGISSAETSAPEATVPGEEFVPIVSVACVIIPIDWARLSMTAFVDIEVGD